jgi:predicted dehydrogenase
MPGLAGLRTIVVGTEFGARVHVPALRAAGFDVVALVGRDPQKARDVAKDLDIPDAGGSLGTCLAAGADVVTIASPPESHHAHVLEALEARCHVLCEKPFTMDAKEARQLAETARRTSVVGAIGHEFRWAPARVAVRDALRSGRIGEPRSGVFEARSPHLADPMVTPVPGWWFDAARGGGWLGANGSHYVDALRWWLGAVTQVSASLRVVSDRQVTAEDSYDLRLRFHGGAEVSMISSAGAWGPPTETSWIAGSAGTVWLVGDEAYVADAASPEGMPLPMVPWPVDTTGVRVADRQLAFFPLLCRAFRSAIEGTPTELPTFEDGVGTMEVLDAARASAAADGEWIRTEGEPCIES